MTEGDAHQRKIVAGVHNATRILTFGTLLVIAVVAARLLPGGESLAVAQISVPVDRAWLAFAVLTLAHLFVAVFLARAIEDYRCRLPSGERAGWVFDEVAASGNAFVHGLVSRALPRRPDGHYYPMSWTDPSAWVARGAALLAAAALLPWWRSSAGLTWHGPGWMALVAAAIVVGNWKAGSHWLIALSELDKLRADEAEAIRRPVDEQDLLRMRRLHAAMQEPGLTRAEFAWLVGRYRSLIEHRPRIGALSPPERTAIARHYEAVRQEFPDCDLPREPWADTARSSGGSA